MQLFLLFAFINPLTISLPDSTQVLPEVTIVSSLKQQFDIFEQPASVSSFTLTDISEKRIESPKELSLITPNFYQPDYGSKMTSSIYVRGLGARIDQPAMGLYVDNLPILNKNCYDFDFFDIRRVDVLRGPQGTLYGRNSIGGVINLFTLSPFDYQGTRFNLGYGNANTFNAGLSVYRRPSRDFGFSLALNHKQSDGFFTNQYDAKKTDGFISDGARFRLQWILAENWTADNITTFNTVKQNGYSYSLYDAENDRVEPINYNDPCGYERQTLSNGLTFRYNHPDILIESTTGFQYLNDAMTLDQDFQPKSYFTITQSQLEGAFTQEVVVKSNKQSRWQWLNGFFGFYKNTEMNAPVTFKRNGIDELILENANNGIHMMFPDGDLLIEEDEFPIYSDFNLSNLGFSLYHQSSFELNKWTFTAGLRMDYEHSFIRYSNSALMHYRFTLSMPDYKALNTEMEGSGNMPFFEFLPKFSAMYHFYRGNVYASLARGYKTGGYNTQIFSDIVQSQMMKGLMSDLGVYFDHVEGSTIESISYKPEYNWNYEVGGSLSFIDNKLSLDAVLFYIDCRNQQLTVFPPGKTTGRMMSNAGSTRSYGAESSLSYNDKRLHLNAAYGYTNARFLTYNDGNNDYSGNYIPYAPQNTVSLSAAYTFHLETKHLDAIRIQGDWQGVGKIYWNEDNSLVQPFYGQSGVSVSLEKGEAKLIFWCKNLSDEKFNTFYFKSMGNSFVQQGKPRQIGVQFQVSF